MYLANDVIQNSKKKGPEFGKEFGFVLKRAFAHMSATGYNEKTKISLGRVLQIWGERGVYDATQIKEFTEAFALPESDENTTPPPSKRSKIELDKNSNKAERGERKSKSDRAERVERERKKSDSSEVLVTVSFKIVRDVGISRINFFFLD